jgi:hypothetical protein
LPAGQQANASGWRFAASTNSAKHESAAQQPLPHEDAPAAALTRHVSRFFLFLIRWPFLTGAPWPARGS